MRRPLTLAAMVCLLVALPSCAGDHGGKGGKAASGSTAGSGSPPAGPAFVTDGPWIRDAEGRVVILRGFDTGNASKHAPYLPWQADAELDEMQEWGVSAVRLIIQWRAVEPQPLVYDDVYLDEVARWIDAAGARGIAVIVDMHQDLYSEAVGGNGAPDWATLPLFRVPPSLFVGLPWYTGYLKPEVITSFDALWADAQITGGTGLIDHYARAWAYVARRFAGNSHIVGFDLMNEPYPGSDIARVLWAGLCYNASFLIQQGLFALIGQQALIDQIVDALRPNSVLFPFLDSMDAPIRDFEENRLMPFYDRVAQAIRAEDPSRLLLIEPTMLKGLGGHSFLRRPVDAAGRPMDGIVYAPHYYDPTMMDGTRAYDGNRARLDEVFHRALSEAQGMDIPLLYGEWGNFAAGVAGAEDCIRDHYDLFDGLRIGALYWSYERDVPSRPHFPRLMHPYPQAIAGTPLSFGWDPAARALTLVFQPTPGSAAETVIYLPAGDFPQGYDLTTTDPSGAFTERYEPAGRTLRYARGAQAPAVPVTLVVRAR